MRFAVAGSRDDHLFQEHIVKPAPFEYVTPETLEEAVGLLAEHGDEAKILAGGQSLIPMLNMRLARPGVLIDINRIPGLDAISVNGELRFGALARHAVVLRSEEVRRHTPIIGAALPHVGHVGIRTRGTIGGSLAHADSAAELPTVLMALGGSVTVLGPSGERTIPVDDLFVTSFTTSLEEDEILVSVQMPAAGADRRSAFLEVARRHGDFALVLVAVTADVSDGVVTSARIALGSVADRTIRATTAEGVLIGKSLDDPAVRSEVAAAVAAEIDPPSDVHASEAYRRQVAGVLVQRALSQMTTQEGGA